MLEAQLRDALLANTPLSTAIASRLFEGHKYQGSTYPAVTFRRVSTNPGYSHDGRSGIYWARITFQVWSKAPEDSRAIATLIIAALDGVRLVANFPSQNKLLNQFADEWTDPEPTIYRELLDIKIWFEE